MPSLIASAMAHLEASMRTNLGVTGRLLRDATENPEVEAVIDTQEYVLTDDGTGAATSVVSVDLLIKPDEYALPRFTPVEPALGDLFVYIDHERVTIELQVMFIPGQPVFMLEPYGRLMRVHTKRTSTL